MPVDHIQPDLSGELRHSNDSSSERERQDEAMSKEVSNADEGRAPGMLADDWRLERLIDRLPKHVRSTVHRVRHPSSRWLRIPTGLMLTVGGLFWFLPIVGLWMLPLGLALLADDLPPLRSLRSRMLDWVEGHRPEWLAHGARPHDPS